MKNTLIIIKIDTLKRKQKNDYTVKNIINVGKSLTKPCTLYPGSWTLYLQM